MASTSLPGSSEVGLCIRIGTRRMQAGFDTADQAVSGTLTCHLECRGPGLRVDPAPPALDCRRIVRALNVREAGNLPEGPASTATCDPRLEPQPQGWPSERYADTGALTA